jgi:hypothetical protein
MYPVVDLKIHDSAGGYDITRPRRRQGNCKYNLWVEIF